MMQSRCQRVSTFHAIFRFATSCHKMFAPTCDDHLDSKGNTLAEILINPETERFQSLMQLRK